MIKLLFLILGFTLISTQVYSSEIIIDTTGWTQDQKNLREAVICSLFDRAGYTFDFAEKPVVIEGDIIKVDETKIIGQVNPNPFDLSSIVGGQAILDEYNRIISENAQNAAIQQAEYLAKKEELKAKLKLTDDDIKNFIEIINKESL